MAGGFVAGAAVVAAGVDAGLVVGDAVVADSVDAGLVVGAAVVAAGVDAGLVVGGAVVVAGVTAGLVVGDAVVAAGVAAGLVVEDAVVVAGGDVTVAVEFVVPLLDLAAPYTQPHAPVLIFAQTASDGATHVPALVQLGSLLLLQSFTATAPFRGTRNRQKNCLSRCKWGPGCNTLRLLRPKR